jgi:mercuric ion transport protein
MGGRTWKQGVLAIPGIGFALLPKLACPLCWPAYAGILSSLGLGFLISASYLLGFTVAFLIVAVAALAFRARQRWGYGPLLFGIAGSAALLGGKFYLESSAVTYVGFGSLVSAAVWNTWPRRLVVIKTK